MRTNVPHIFAIGDIVGNPMLAHKATHEGKLAAEVAAGEKKEWVARVIPSVAYTDPEIAWVGVTETEAKAKGLKVGVGKFPWAASARAVGIGRSEGFTKLIFDEETHRVIGGGIVGVHAGDLIAEVALAIEMGAEAGDIGHTIHPHPTLSETVAWRPRSTTAPSPTCTCRRRSDAVHPLMRGHAKGRGNAPAFRVEAGRGTGLPKWRGLVTMEAPGKRPGMQARGNLRCNAC
jgi:hypothetical protein